MTNIPLSERSRWVGGSEVAALFGVSPFTTRWQLYREKRGELAPENLDNNERVMAGRYLEPAIAGWAGEKWAWPIAKVSAYIPHPSVPQFGVSLDFRDETTGWPVEIKNQDGAIFRDRWETEGDEIVSAPAYYLIQVQAQIACTGADGGWLLACVGGNRLVRLEVERNDDFIARMEEEVDAFWRAVRNGREPALDFGKDVDAMSRLWRSSRGDVVDLQADNEIPAACAEYLTAKKAEKDAKERAEFWKGVILEKIQDAPGAIANGFTIQLTDVPEAHVSAFTKRAYRRFRVEES